MFVPSREQPRAACCTPEVQQRCGSPARSTFVPPREHPAAKLAGSGPDLQQQCGSPARTTVDRKVQAPASITSEKYCDTLGTDPALASRRGRAMSDCFSDVSTNDRSIVCWKEILTLIREQKQIQDNVIAQLKTKIDSRLSALEGNVNMATSILKRFEEHVSAVKTELDATRDEHKHLFQNTENLQCDVNNLERAMAIQLQQIQQNDLHKECAQNASVVESPLLSSMLLSSLQSAVVDEANPNRNTGANHFAPDRDQSMTRNSGSLLRQDLLLLHAKGLKHDTSSRDSVHHPSLTAGRGTQAGLPDQRLQGSSQRQPSTSRKNVQGGAVANSLDSTHQALGLSSRASEVQDPCCMSGVAHKHWKHPMVQRGE